MSKSLTISVPSIGERKFAMPETPEGISSALRSAIDDYRAHLWGDGTALSGDTWSQAALAIANHAPASLTEAALKLLWLTHYAEPTTDKEGNPDVDLAAFDCDIGHHLIRVASDILGFEPSRDERGTWGAALAEYRTKRAYSDTLADDHAEVDEAVDAYCVAMDRLIDTRAPSHAALIYKLDLIAERFEDFNTPEGVWAEVRKDVAALGAAANGEA